MRSLFLFSAVALVLTGCPETPGEAPIHAPAASSSAVVAADAGPAVPVAGGACSQPEREICTGAQRALVCLEGVWTSLACPSGCGPAEGRDRCDQTGATVGDRCSPDTDFMCAKDKKALIRCVGHLWQLESTCGGVNACVVDTKKVTCDNSLAAEHDRCAAEDDYACMASGKFVLACRRREFAIVAACSGPKGCEVVGPEGARRVQCDDSITTLGAACEKDGHYSCTADGKQILVCKKGAFVADDKCKGKERCAIRGEQVGCF